MTTINSSTARDLKIAIVGAGPAGTTLARLLQLKGFTNVRLYEREPSPHVRQQGGTLDLHPESGLAAMKACGLMSEFEKHARYDEEGMLITDKHGKIYFYDEALGGPESTRPEIDRLQLRQILLASLKPDTIQWSKHLLSVIPNGASGHKHILQFKDGSRDEADLVVGADGAWSKVKDRIKCDELRPVYTGLQMADLTISDPTPYLFEKYGKGMAFMLSSGQGVLVQKNGGRKLKLYYAQLVDENVELVKPDENIDTLKTTMEKLYQGWHPDVLKLLEETDGAEFYRAWKMYAIKPGAKWDTVPGVTLIGDSAHVMSPFAGEGVNMAMSDALELAEILDTSLKTVSAPVDLTSILTAAQSKYEQGMQKRVKPIAQESAANLDKCFRDAEAPQEFVKYVESFGPPSIASIVRYSLMAISILAYIGISFSRRRLL